MDLFDYYPHVPGHNSRDTSIAAASSIEPHVSLLAAKVFALIEAKPRTCWEIEQESGLSHQTASARIRELNLKGRVRDSGERRRTGSGRNAIVWMVAGHAQPSGATMNETNSPAATSCAGDAFNENLWENDSEHGCQN